ncbi:hypothetical protein AAY473_001257 [Plecturocebus cupreus]
MTQGGQRPGDSEELILRRVFLWKKGGRKALSFPDPKARSSAVGRCLTTAIPLLKDQPCLQQSAMMLVALKRGEVSWAVSGSHEECWLGLCPGDRVTNSTTVLTDSLIGQRVSPCCQAEVQWCDLSSLKSPPPGSSDSPA